MKPHYLALLCSVLLLAGCGMSTKFASRKYIKGYFVDNPEMVKQPASLPQLSEAPLTINIPITTRIPREQQPKEPSVSSTQSAQSKQNSTGHRTISTAPRNLNKQSPGNAPTVATQNQILDAVAQDGDGNGGRHATKDESSTASYDKKASWFFGGVCLIGLILYGVFAFMESVGITALIDVGFPLLIVGGLIMLVLDLFAVSYALEAISRNEPNPAGSYVVLSINLLALLFAAIAALGSN